MPFTVLKVLHFNSALGIERHSAAISYLGVGRRGALTPWHNTRELWRGIPPKFLAPTYSEVAFNFSIWACAVFLDQLRFRCGNSCTSWGPPEMWPSFACNEQAQQQEPTILLHVQVAPVFGVTFVGHVVCKRQCDQRAFATI